MSSRRLVVAFACNDDNGTYDGRARGFSVHGRGWDVEFDHDDPIDGRVFKVDWKLMTLTIHRVTYPFTSHREGYGNMCWTAFRMKRPAALRLILAINQQSEWTLSGGSARVCDWLERKRRPVEYLASSQSIET
jgi:hypothetical protein